MNETFSLIIGIALLILMAMFMLKGVVTARMLEREPEEGIEELESAQACPAEIVESIFSERDQEFIRRLQSPRLCAYFEAERRSVALLWVRQTAAGIRRIMREHAAAARRSADLQVMTEVRLVLQYSGLMLLCGVLLISIPLVGPLWVRSLAGYAQRLSEGIARTQLAFAASLESRQARAEG
jgi:hypothetical protein